MNIIVPFDGTPSSQKALVFALKEYADDERDVYIQVTYFNTHDDDTSYSLYEKESKKRAEEVGFDPEKVTFEIEVTSEADKSARKIGNLILEYVESNDFDHIIMGQNDKGLTTSILKGSTSTTVSNESNLPTTIVPN
jgi:nucleotide-binding universal stress UspA family protein